MQQRQKTICMDIKIIKRWTILILEAWLRHVYALQERAGAHDPPTLLDGPLTYTNKIYIQQSANLK